MNKTFTKALIFLSFLVSSINEAYASHAMGADLTYRCIGPGSTPGSSQYQLTFSLYRDCVGIVAPAYVDVQVGNSCGYIVQDVIMLPLTFTPRQISPVCPTGLTTCNGGTYTGIQEWIYLGTVDLPGPCADWTFSHGENARNLAITTLVGFPPVGPGTLYIYSMLNNTNGICNNSPTFSNRPVPFVCNGQQFCFNHGAYDVEGDSLSYEIITPLTGPNPGDTVTHLPGFTSTQPLISNPPMSFNTHNGDFCMTPSQIDITVLAVLVSEYRNGVLIGQVERDIQVTVIPCSNTLPVLSGINGTSSYKDTICAGVPYCFYVASSDPDLPNRTKVQWNSSIPGATFTPSNTFRDSAMFCWTPSINDINPLPYCFTATVTDDNCPYMGIQVYSYCMKVNGLIADAGPDQTIACGNTANLSGTASGGDGNFNFTWNPGGINSQLLIGASVGRYFLTVNSAGCSYTDSIDVLPGTGIPITNFSLQNNCSGLPIIFIDSTTVTGSTLTNWVWNFGDGNSDTTRNPVHQYPADGIYYVNLKVTAASGCWSTFTRKVIIDSNVPQPEFNYNKTCFGEVVDFTNQTTGVALTQWSWDFNDTTGNDKSFGVNPSHSFSAPGTFIVSLTVTDSLGCKNTILKSVTVNPIPVINAFHSDPVCEYDPVQFIDSSVISSGSIASVLWNFGNGQTSNLSSPSIFYNSPGTYVTDIKVTSDSGCAISSNFPVTIYPQPHAAFSHSDVCLNNPSVFSDLSAIIDSSALIYSWDLGDNFTSSGKDVIHQYSSVGNYLVNLLVTSNHGCVNSTTDTVNVFALPIATFKPDYACEGLPSEFFDLSQVAGGSIVNWFWSFGDSIYSSERNPVHQYSFAGNYNVRLFVNSNHGCADSTFRVLRIAPKPVVEFTTEDACLGIPVRLTDSSHAVTGTIVTYDWDLGDGLHDNIQNPMHEYRWAGSYFVRLTVTTDSGCVATRVQPKALNIFGLPDASFRAIATDDENSYPVIHFINETSPYCTYRWSFGDGTFSEESSPIHLYTEAGNYEIMLLALDYHGCVDSVEEMIEVDPVSTIYIPNSFSPNDDGRNDYFKVYSTNMIDVHVQIYDRWGLMIIEWDNLEGKWDGVIKGEGAQQDTYVYRVSTVDVNGKEKVYTGHVNLVR